MNKTETINNFFRKAGADSSLGEALKKVRNMDELLEVAKQYGHELDSETMKARAEAVVATADGKLAGISGGITGAGTAFGAVASAIASLPLPGTTLYQYMYTDARMPSKDVELQMEIAAAAFEGREPNLDVVGNRSP